MTTITEINGPIEEISRREERVSRTKQFIHKDRGPVIPAINYGFLLIKIGIKFQTVWQVIFAHFPPMTPDQVPSLLDKARAYVDEIEQTVLAATATKPSLQLAEIWQATFASMGRHAEFRALNMVHAHMQDLVMNGLVEATGPQQHRLVR